MDLKYYQLFGDILNLIRKVDLELSPGKLKHEITFNVQRKILKCKYLTVVDHSKNALSSYV